MSNDFYEVVADINCYQEALGSAVLAKDFGALEGPLYDRGRELEVQYPDEASMTIGLWFKYAWPLLCVSKSDRHRR